MNDERIVLKDSGLSALKNTISDLIYELSVIEAEDEQSIKQIGVLFKETTAVEKEMESLRKFYVDPLNDTVKKINAIFKAELKELQDVIDEKKTEIAKYHARITMEAKKRAEEEQKALYADVPEEFPIKTEVVPQIPKLSEIATGMKTVTVKTWRLVALILDLYIFSFPSHDNFFFFISIAYKNPSSRLPGESNIYTYQLYPFFQNTHLRPS